MHMYMYIFKSIRNKIDLEFYFRSTVYKKPSPPKDPQAYGYTSKPQWPTKSLIEDQTDHDLCPPESLYIQISFMLID